jgi:uncharacterized DUF497 family protein
MGVDGIAFDWDEVEAPEGNVRHIAQHNVTPEEFEQAVLDPRGYVLGRYEEGGEERVAVVGSTTDGRILVTIYAPRQGRIRPVTAYPARPRFIRRYEEGIGL